MPRHLTLVFLTQTRYPVHPGPKRNCIQSEVIDRLIELKQSEGNREWPHVFNGVTLDLKVWERDEEEKKGLTNINIGVFQSTIKEPSKKMAVREQIIFWDQIYYLKLKYRNKFTMIAGT